MRGKGKSLFLIVLKLANSATISKNFRSDKKDEFDRSMKQKNFDQKSKIETLEKKKEIACSLVSKDNNVEAISALGNQFFSDLFSS